MTRVMTRLLPTLVVLLAGLLASRPAEAQDNTVEDRFAQALFAPDLVMQHARRIGLTDAQRSAITAAIQELQGRAVGLQLEMIEELQRLLEMLEQPRVTETQIVPLLNRVLDKEQEVKVTQTLMLIRIKNALTPEQQATLRELRDRQRDEETA